MVSIKTIKVLTFAIIVVIIVEKLNAASETFLMLNLIIQKWIWLNSI